MRRVRTPPHLSGKYIFGENAYFCTWNPITGVPRRELGGSTPHWVMCLQNIPSSLCSCSQLILNFLQENVKKLYTNFTFCFSSGGGASSSILFTEALPLNPTGGFPSRWPPGQASRNVSPLHCKILGTPVNPILTATAALEIGALDQKERPYAKKNDLSQILGYATGPL